MSWKNDSFVGKMPNYVPYRMTIYNELTNTNKQIYMIK